MNIAYIILTLLTPKAKSFEEATKDPLTAQRRVLLKYLARNKNTEYGRKYNFAAIKTVEEYRARVPLNNSESMYPYIERMAKGEGNILTTDKVNFFGITSGTTGKPKLIPSTEYSRAKKMEVMDIWSYYISRDYPDILSGKILAVINTEVEGFTESGVPFGGESGHAHKNMPPIVRSYYAVPYEVFEIADYDARYYTVLRISMAENITTIATLTPSTLILLMSRIEALQERIIRDIENGTLDAGLNIEPRLRQIVEKRLKPDPERAGELKRILKEKKALLPKDFWPNLKLIECWKGGTVKLYLKELPKYFGPTPIRDIGCVSTEARSSIPMTDEGAAGALAIKTNFYEFIPKEEMQRGGRATLLCDQLEKGKEYFLVVTTPGGLYRYNIDDVITVRGFLNRTPVIEFVQKGLHAVSMVGEKLYESQVNEAINRAATKLGLLIKFFSAAAEIDRAPRYAFLVEFSEDVAREKKEALLSAIEQELYKENREYLFTREAQLLAKPVLKVVKNGSFEAYRAKKIKEGAHDTQFKAPQLTDKPGFEENFVVEETIPLG